MSALHHDSADSFSEESEFMDDNDPLGGDCGGEAEVYEDGIYNLQLEDQFEDNA